MTGRWKWIAIAGIVLVAAGGGAPPLMAQSKSEPKPAAAPKPAAEADDAMPSAGRLSAPARRLISELQLRRPVRIEAFLSPEVPESYAPMRGAVVAVLKDIEALGGGKIKVRVYDTERFSDEADRAEGRYKITARQVVSGTRQGTRTDNLFLGVAMTSGLESVIVPFLDRGMSAEYELVRSLCTVTGQKRKRVGVLLTDAPLLGRLDPRTMAFTSKWPILQEIEKQYEAVRVDPAEPITARYDVLLAVQPSSLSPEGMDRFVEALRKGQPALVFEDPFPMFALDVTATSAPRRPPGGLSMMPGAARPLPKGDVAKLWQLLGIDFSTDEVVWQNYNPYPQLGGLPKEFVFVDAASGAKEPFHLTDPVSAGVQHMLFPFPGHLNELARSPLECTPLVRTGNVTGTVRYSEMLEADLLGPGPLNESRRQVPTDTPYVLAARIRGKLPSSEATQPLDVVLVADVDMLHDSFFRLREQGEMEESGVHFDFDNVPFLLNALDVLAKDERFLAMRRRVGKHPILARTPEQIAADRKTGEARYRMQRDYDQAVQREEKAVKEGLAALEKRLREDKLSALEMATAVDLASKDAQRRLQVKLEQLKRKRDLEISRIGRKPSSRKAPPVDADDVRGEPLFPRFDDPLAVASLEIVARSPDADRPQRILLARTRSLWTVRSHHDFPANVKDRLAEAVTGLMRLTVLDAPSADAADHALYGVVDPDDGVAAGAADGVGVRVTIQDAEGRTLLALVLGKSVRDQAELRYVRRAGQVPVYVVQAKTDRLSADLADWIDRDLLRLDPRDISRVEIADYSVDAARSRLIHRSQMTFEHHDAGPAWRLVDWREFLQGTFRAKSLGQNEELNAAKLDALRAALAELTIVDVEGKPAALAAGLRAEAVHLDQESVTSMAARGFFAVMKAGEREELLAKEGEVRLRMKDGVVYVLRFGEIAGSSGSERTAGKIGSDRRAKRYLFVSAELDAKAIAKSEDSQEPGLRGKKRVEELNSRFANWYFVISDDVFRKIRLGQEQLIRPRKGE